MRVRQEYYVDCDCCERWLLCDYDDPSRKWLCPDCKRCTEIKVCATQAH